MFWPSERSPRSPQSNRPRSPGRQNIYLLRKALGEGPHDQSCIETIPKRGYRFVAPVRVLEGQAPAVEQDKVVHRGSDAKGPSDEPEAISRVERIGVAGTSRDRKRVTNRTLRVAAIVIVALAAAPIAWRLLNRARPSEAPEPIRSIAVLPFKTIGREPRDEILELGIADTLITKLGGLTQVIVRPTSAVRKYSGLDQDPLAAGREQRADLVLEGTVQRLGERIRVTVRLLSVPNGGALLTDTLDESMRDVFTLQDSISDRVVRALALKLAEDERIRLSKRGTVNAEAFQLYLRGRYFWEKRTADSLQRAIGAFQEAIERDPGYAQAYVGLADVHITLPYDTDAAPREALPKAKAAAIRALEIDDTLADAHAALGFVNGVYEWDWPGAERVFRRALALNPNSPTVHQRFANYLVVMGMDAEAIDETRRALSLDPVSLATNALAGRSYYLLRRYDQAIEQCREALDLDANFWIAHFFAGKAYAQKALYADAAAELRKAGDVTTEALATMAYVDAASGNRAEATKILAQLIGRADRSFVPPSHVAKIHVALGDYDRAFEWLDKAYQARDSWLQWLAAEPQWDRLRADPRFTDLLRRVGLPVSSSHRM
jgi:TolB-like protein/Tfp pilus assembly protein PilF